ncbi:MAG: alpha/beta hydrolase [Oscillospiraceae bacterium]|nr:alpha/beta hydrolase [Oscillospiraceae bacterium]
MIVSVNSLDLFYVQGGEGRPLVMLHGNGEDHGIFDEAAAVLEKDFRCYRLDSRGHGQSTQVSELHYADMADDLIGFLEALDLRDVVLYGFSDGGIAALLAAARCERVSTLIVSGANCTPQGVKLWLRLLFRLEYLLRRDAKIALMLHEPQIGEAELRAIRARTLVLAGSRDLIREAETRRIAEAIPGAELRILPGETHGSYIVHKAAIGEIIRDFVLGAGEERRSRND